MQSKTLKAKRGRPKNSENIKLVNRSEAFNLGYTEFCNGKSIDSLVYAISHTLGKAERTGYNSAKLDEKKTNPV